MKALIFILFLLTTVYPADTLQTDRVKFDPTRDPVKDLKEAVKTAKAEKKMILLDIGGEWCIWCHRLDEFIAKDKEISDALHKTFVVMKVNYSKENKNEEFLSKYPKVPGYPHFFVLDKDGKFVQSQDTGELEAEKSYSRDKLLAFINRWNKKPSVK